MKYSDNCEHVGKIAEYLSKNKYFEKCFTYFNINKIDSRFNGFKMNKSSFIEFLIPSKLLKNEYNLNRNETDLVYVSVHSSQSIFKTDSFQPIIISFESDKQVVQNFKFSKILVQSLHWPHDTNCINNEFTSKSGVIYSFDDCVNSCIFAKIYGQNKCIQTNDTFEIDLIIDNKSRDMEFCVENFTKRNDFQKIEIFCIRKCRRNCINEYFQVEFRNKNPRFNKSITINTANAPLLQYELIPKYSIFVYASNLGEIITMWLGGSVIDLYKLLKQFIIFLIDINKKIRHILNSCENFQILFISKLIILFGFINKYISLITFNIKKINWKLLLRIICLVCFAYQSIEMTIEYLEYKTKVHVRIVEDLMDGSDKSTEIYPAISICASNIVADKSELIDLDNQIYPRWFVLPDKYFDNNFVRFFNDCEIINFRCKMNYTNYEKILNNQTLVSDYLNVIDLKMHVIWCQEITKFGVSNCLLNGLITSHYLEFKCYTFMSKLSEMFRKNMTYKNFGYQFQIIGEVGKLFYYIHDSNQLPSFPTSEFPSIPKTEILYEKKFFKLLPAPYETNCFDYSNTIYKSQSECIIEHIIQKYLENDCLPQTNEMITYVVDNYNYSKFKHKFCENVSIPTKYIDSLTKICLKSCNEVLYEILRLKHEHALFLYPSIYKILHLNTNLKWN
jgi:hypothetical protein